MARDVLLAIGVLFATYSQLRFVEGSPVGPGELCILAWIGWMLVTAPRWATAEPSAAFRKLASFWMLFAAALAIGTMVSYLTGNRNSPSHFFHDVTAYILVASVGLLALLPADAGRRLRRTEWALVGLGSALLALQLGQAYGVIASSGLVLWFYDRLTGWTTNANQLALQCLVLAFVALHLTTTAVSRRERLLAALCVVLPLVCGYLTRSDAFLLSVAVGALGLLVLMFWRVASQHGRRKPLQALALTGALTLVIASASAVVYVAVHNPADLPSAAGEDELRLERDMGYRTELWSEAAARIVGSGFLGLGPGPQLVRPADLREPELDTLPDFEAHNTLIDLMLQGGLLAAGALLWLAGSTALRLLRLGNLIYAHLLASLGLFSMTHYIVRHPIFWLSISLALTAAYLREDSKRERFSPVRSAARGLHKVPLPE